MPRAMSSAEVDDFLARNPDAAGRVIAFGNFKDTMGWDQIAMAYFSVFHIFSDVGGWFGSVPAELPIPAGGLAVSDPYYGNVVIFPDAAGELHFTCDVTAGVANQINLPVYTSPTGNTLAQILADLKSVAVKLGGAVMVGLIVTVVVNRLLEAQK